MKNKLNIYDDYYDKYNSYDYNNNNNLIFGMSK